MNLLSFVVTIGHSVGDEWAPSFKAFSCFYDNANFVPLFILVDILSIRLCTSFFYC